MIEVYAIMKSLYLNVGNFVAASYPNLYNFNQFQRANSNDFNVNLLEASKILQISISLGIGFGTRRSVVQIHSPRSFIFNKILV